MGEKRETARIIIAMHRPYRRPDGELYVPVQAGKALSDMDLRMQGDDEGENISNKNPNYCELTAVYWAWKNLNADYIGLAHYRRHFCVRKKRDKWDGVLNGRQLRQILNTVPVILPKRRNYFIETNESQYLHAHHREGWDAMIDIVESDYPEYVPALHQMRKSTKGHRFNMFVMKREYFCAYCEWLFDILFKVEKRIDISGYSKSEARVFGYLGERLLDVWVETNHICYTELGVAFMEKQNWVKKGMAFLKRKFFGDRQKGRH